jgi:glycosyltransferase involved in cell wall biosynthesis
MKKPLLSIVIPVYNTGKVVGRIINHILKQEFSDFELILVNDGSKDDSLDRLKEFAAQDTRVKVIDQKNGGASSARNTGIQVAQGKYLMMLDSDDDIDPTMINKLVQKIERGNLDLVTCGIKYITIKNGKQSSAVNIGVTQVPAQNKKEDWAVYIVKLIGDDGRLYNPCNKIFRLDIIKKHKIQYEAGLNLGEDLTFNLAYMKYIKNLGFINEPLYHYYFDITTGTFGKSSLVYDNYLKNFSSLKSFASVSNSDTLPDLLGWIKYKWFYTFSLAVSGSSLKHREKIKLLKDAIASEKFVPAKNTKVIGKNRRLIERFLKTLSKTPTGLLTFMKLSNSIKSNQLSAKTWRKLMSTMTNKK